MIKKTVFLATFIGGSIIGNSQVFDYPVHTKKIRTCEGDSVSLMISKSQLNTTYQLLDKNNNILGNTTAGIQDTLTFNSGALLTNDTLKVKAFSVGSALSFDGVSNYVNFGNPSLGTSVSVAMWVKTTSTYQSVLAEKYDFSSKRGFVFSLNANGTVQMKGGSSSAVVNDFVATSTSAVNDGNWHHIIGVFTTTGSRVEVYVDGAKENTTTVTNTPNLSFSGNLIVGNGSLGYFDGEIDELTFFNRQTFPSEALAFLTSCNTPIPTQDILGYYKINGGIGTTLNKKSGTWANGNIAGTSINWVANALSCNDSLVLSQEIPIQVLNLSQVSLSVSDLTLCPNGGTQRIDISTSSSDQGLSYSLRDDSNDTLVGAPLPATGTGLTFTTYPTAPITYNVLASSGNSHAVNLMGTTSSPYIDITNNNRKITKKITIALWIKTTDAGTLKRIMQNNDATSGYVIETNTTGNVQFKARVIGNSTYRTTGFSTTAINDGAWHQITAVSNVTNTGNSPFILYIDGVQESIAYVLTGGAATFASSNATIIGHPTVGITGELDQLAIWNDALTATQVKEAYNYCIPTNSDSLVALFNFNEGSGVIFNDLSSSAIDGAMTSGNAIWVSGLSPSCEAAFCELEMTNKVSITESDSNLTVSAVNPSVCLGDSGMVSIQNSEVGMKYMLLNSGTSAVVDSGVVGNGSTINLKSGAINSLQTFKVLAEEIPTIAPSALNFDGIDNEVHLGTDNRGVTTVVTMSAWIKTTGPQTGGIYFIASKLGNSNGYRMWMNDAGKIYVDGKKGTSTSLLSSGASVGAVNDNNWHYVTGVFNVTNQSSRIKIYIDGVLDKNTVVSPGNDASGNGITLVVGDNANRNFNGQIDQFSLWNKELSLAEIQSKMSGCFEADANLKGHFTFDEGTGLVATDFSSTSLNGTLVGINPVTDWVAGDISCVSCSFELNQTASIGVTTIDNSVAQNNNTVTANQTGATYKWLDCNNAYAAISGQTNRMYTASSSGSYAVEITMNGCVDTSLCNTVATVGLNNNALQSINTYPNPVKNKLTIESGELNINEIKIINVSGKIVDIVSTNVNTINVSSLMRGIYFMQISTKEGIFTTKFIKE
jgi:hypothetical protein